jgi:hypothetical protein
MGQPPVCTFDCPINLFVCLSVAQRLKPSNRLNKPKIIFTTFTIPPKTNQIKPQNMRRKKQGLINVFQKILHIEMPHEMLPKIMKIRHFSLKF